MEALASPHRLRPWLTLGASLADAEHVFRADHERFGPVLVKRLDRHGRAAVERFQREAAALASLASPHIVHVLEVGVDDPPYLATEWLAGEDLRARLGRVGRFEPAAVTRLLRELGEGLRAVHAHGLVHRDLKPSNIFLRAPEDTAVLLDFGLVKDPRAVDLTRSGELLGTPSTMSPEQLDGARRVDARADLWSLAVVAYLALTGTLPFPGASLAGVTVAVMLRRYSPPSAHGREFAPFDDWFARAFAGPLDQRFQSVDELVAALPC